MITSILSGTSQPIDARVVVSNGPHAAGPQPRHKGRDPASRRRPTATSQGARSGPHPRQKGRDPASRRRSTSTSQGARSGLTPPAYSHVTRGEIRPHAAGPHPQGTRSGPHPRHKGRDPASRRRPTATSQRTRATSLQHVKHAALRTQKDCNRTAKEPKQSKTKQQQQQQN